MTKFFKDFARDESGASAAEYALILAVIGVGIVTAGIALQGSISDVMNDTANCVNTGTAAGCTR